ncbi:MAG: phosphopyruvate hydratase [Candidatus Parcubacteria bacterium]|nr:phosphopyruvate hydratase [Candidatus Parcubacteria bacterium]
MFESKKIKKIIAREILDSRGNPTLEVKVRLSSGIEARASVPSGASTGSHEALELRDDDKRRYNGKGVLKAIKNVNDPVDYLLRGMDIGRQQDIDKLMIKLDDTNNKKEIGANASLGVSLACARAGALASNLSLYKYLRKVYNIQYSHYKLPIPLMNVLNGGKHANWATDIQEFMIVPQSKTMAKRVQIGTEVFHALAAVLKNKGYNTLVGDEGGYAPKLKNNEDALKLLLLAVKKANYNNKAVGLAIDSASTEFYNFKTKLYRFDRKKLTAASLINIYAKWQKTYKLVSIEDGLAEDDWANWQKLSAKLGDKCLLIGDDLFVTNEKRLHKGIDQKAANAILIKPNQIGTLTETISTISLAKKNGFKVIISHRSGETADTFIADLAVAVNADYIKAGSLSRSERVEKYNRLMEIEEELK